LEASFASMSLHLHRLRQEPEKCLHVAIRYFTALVADGQVHVQAGQVGDGVAELEQAARPLPDRPEAWALLGQLASSGKP
jgi:predicted Zn-dependent protease